MMSSCSSPPLDRLQPFPNSFPDELIYLICQHILEDPNDGDARLRLFKLVSKSCKSAADALLKPIILTLSSDQDWEEYFEPFSTPFQPKATRQDRETAERSLGRMSRITYLKVASLPPLSVVIPMERARELAFDIEPTRPLFSRVNSVIFSNIQFDSIFSRPVDEGRRVHIDLTLNVISSLVSPKHVVFDLGENLLFYTSKDCTTENRPPFEDYILMKGIWTRPYTLLHTWIQGWPQLQSIGWVGVPFRGALDVSFPGYRNDYWLASSGSEPSEEGWQLSRLMESKATRPEFIGPRTQWRFYGLNEGLISISEGEEQKIDHYRFDIHAAHENDYKSDYRDDL